MKQKLPEKKSSYKNLYLGEIQKTRILSTSWVKRSLLGLLIAKFLEKKKIINSLNFRMITLSMDLRNLEKNDDFILNSLILFTLLMFISIYSLNTTNIVERNNFSLAKVRRKDYNRKDSMGIYKKSFRNFNKNFDIFLPNVSEKIKLSRHEFSFDIIRRLNAQIFVDGKQNDPFEKGKDKFIYQLNFHFFYKEMRNDDFFFMEKEILQNLESLGESNEILVKSSFFFREKGHLYFSNYMKMYLWKLFTNNYRYWEKFEPETFLGKNTKYFSDQLNSPKLYLNLENIISNAVYKFSRHLRYKVKESNIQIRSENLLDNKMSKNFHILDYPSMINKNVKKNWKFHKLHIDNYNLKWITKILYSKDKSIPKSIFRKRTFFKKILSSLRNKPKSFFNFLKEPSKSQYIKNINNFFPQPKKKTDNPIFFESLLIDRFKQELISGKKNNKISQNFGTIRQLKNNREFDDIDIISSKTRKYHSNFLLNCSFPSNHAFNIISQNDSSSGKMGYTAKKKSNGFLLRVFNLFPSFSESKKTISLINCIDLIKHLVIKTKQLDIVVDQLNEIEDQNFLKKILLVSRGTNSTYDERNKFIKHDLLLKNSIYINSNKYYSKFFNNSFFKLFYSEVIYKKNILNKCSRLWKTRFQQSFLCNIGNRKYENLSFDFYYWLYEMRNSSNKIVTFHFPINLKKSFESSKSENVNQIYRNISNLDVEPKNILNKILIENSHLIEKNMNNLLADQLIEESNNKIIIHSLLTTFLTKNTILLDGIKSENLFVNSNNYFLNFEPNYKKNFLFYSRENTVGNHSIIYLQFLKNFSKYEKFNQNLIEKKNYQFSQLNLTNKFDKTKFVYFPDLCKEISKKIKLSFSTNSKIYLSEQEKKKILIKVLKKLETDGIGKDMLSNLTNVKIGNYYNILRYESLTKKITRNSLLFKFISKIFSSLTLKYSKLNNFEPQVQKEKFIHIDKVFNKLNPIEILNFFEGYLPIKDFNYTFWFFTWEWWEYSVQLFTKSFEKLLLIIGSYFAYSENEVIRFIQNNFVNFCKDKRNLYIFNSKWNSRFSSDYKEKIILNFLWSDYLVIHNLNNLHWVIFSSIFFALLFSQNYFSIFIGSDSINLWTYFENIKYLTDTSRASYFLELLHRNKMQLTKTENVLNYFVNNLKHYTRNIRFYLVTKKKLNKWLLTNKSLDLSRRKRNLLVQSLITPTRIKEYGFQFYPQPKILNNSLFGYNTNSQQGLTYLRYVSRMLKKNLVNYSLHLADKWIFFASLQKIISLQTLQQTKNFNPRFQKIPLPLQLGLSCAKGVLLIGPIESGRSYLIKNLAADSSVPLLGISINKLMYNKPDVITESWMNILIESLRRLNLILDLAKGMSPCIIWIRNIHQLDVNRSTQNIESDPTFLLGILLKHFQTDSLKIRAKNNIIMIGSTHLPKKVDPSLISPDRLDRILNIRLLNTYQRKNEFPRLLNRNNLQLNKNLLYFNEFGPRTMGYNIRDLAALTNEISLISLTKNTSFVYDDIIKLAFNRQILGFSHTNNKPNYQQNLKILLYKIGRAIIQNTILHDFATNPLNISNYLWKRKFYYLSKWYLEPSMDDSIIKESTILVHVLSCLAGIAARDSWFLLEKDVNKSISLDKSIENDLDLAYSILETFSSDFPLLETCENQFFDGKKKKPHILLTKNFSNIMHNGIFAITDKSIGNTQNDSQDEYLLVRNKTINRIISEFKNTAWSPRSWRLNFCRSHLFDWIKRPTDFEFFHTFGFSKKKNFEKKNHEDQFIGRKKEQLFYERILPRVRKRNVEELESQFENILLEEQFEILGFFNSTTQYKMEYQLNNKPRLFIGKRVLWDPIGSFPQLRRFVFSSREFFVDEEMLRRLYITYGVRRERERSLSSHRIKRFFIGRGYNKDLINKLSVRWWNQLPIDQKQNIYTLKRIEKIGIRLKRPQIFTPVYLYQRWLIENIPGKFSRLDLLTHRDRWIKMNTILLNDSFTYNILLESYKYLFEFFSSNKILLDQITKTLLKKKWMFQNEIVSIIYNMKK
uniref:Ycf2 n=1 Tax=Diplophyllum taxifolium TaxID=248355 RepID=A0A7S6VKK8_9MARC|nr:Ycf2 [Diplophyllum taxifolium]QOW40214.1 Ycf2 [Diplophyllum taxifolium]